MRAVFRVKIATPLSVGWYDHSKLDSRFVIRPTSLKGVWRWWARAFVGGVLYERGCLKSRRGGGVYFEPDPEGVKKISRIVGAVLGMGYAERAEAAASSFKIAVRMLKRPFIGTVTKGQRSVEYGDGKRAEFQRFNLLSLSTSVEYAVGGEFEIEITGRTIDSKRFTLGLEILAAALTLSGVGKGSRKGLGSLDVTWTNYLTPTPVEKLIEDVRRELNGVIPDKCGGQSWDLPPMPVMTKAKIRGEGAGEVALSAVYKVTGLDPPSLHNFFLRPHRARVTEGHYSKPDELRKRLEAWVLGLPREQKDTGYSAEVDRRASTFIVSYHGRDHIFNTAKEPGGYLTVLISGDWPTEIHWSDSDEKVIEIDQTKIISAYSTAYREFENYVTKLKGKVTQIW